MLSHMDELTTAQAALVLGVDRSTVRRYADAGLLTPRKTAGGHRRYDAAAVHALRNTDTLEP